ncbi:hypothetical protein AB0883_28605 [Micromonospora sp. NPDC047812]
MTAVVSVPAAGATAPALRLRPVVHASPVDAGIHVLPRRLLTCPEEFPCP